VKYQAQGGFNPNSPPLRTLLVPKPISLGIGVPGIGKVKNHYVIVRTLIERIATLSHEYTVVS